MPAQSGKSSLFGNLNPVQIAAAHAEAKAAPLNPGMISIPAGIEGGIAKLVSLKLGRYESGANEGKPYFMARGTAVYPLEHKGRKVYGLPTQIGPEPLCDTPNSQGKKKTFGDHWAWMMNQLALLMEPDGKNKLDQALDTGLDPGDKNYGAKLEANLMSLIEELNRQAQDDSEPKIYFMFRTSRLPKTVVDQRSDGRWALYQEDEEGNRTPHRTNKNTWSTKESAEQANPYAGRESAIYQEWNGATEYSEEAPAGMLEDNTASTKKASNKSLTKNGSVNVEGGGKEDHNADGAWDRDSVEKLVQEVNDTFPKDRGPAKRLKELAMSLGISEGTVELADSWDDIGEMIVGRLEASGDAGEGDAGDDVGDATEEIPALEVGSVVKYQVINAKTGKLLTEKGGKPKQPVPCEVEEINEEDKTCTILSLVDRETRYTDVAWDNLTTE